MYRIIDTFDLEETRVVSEKELRDIYKENVKEILFNWWNCGDSKIREDLMEELANVYTCNIQFVINNLKEDLAYNIEKIEED